MIGKSQQVQGHRFITHKFELDDASAFRALGELLKVKAENCIAVLFNISDGKISILCTVSPDLVSVFNAGKVVGKVAALLDGKGGGRADLAMAGARDLALLDEVIAKCLL